ncbi:ABC transporter ATP-binding protein [Actinomadura atramentaria]|uniref:ABC transporter ATP-binding protein n=1 Tax=Actinomadura atramentaria TaxID=1990 RepID=UPI000373C573|nr:ABC transporter ATP-binding protein [Actinomadura atramentaria]
MKLEVSDLRCAYGARPVLHGVSIAVDAGECVSVVGANGVGKSTLLNAVAGLVPARAGTVRLDGRDVTARGAPWRVRHGLVLCPEGRHLFPGLTVHENLVVGGIASGARRAAINARVAELTELFPVIGKRRDQAAGTLSGGEQQMVAIGRAMMGRPAVLVLDEPTLGLAPLMVDAVIAAVREIADGGTAVVLAEQNLHASLSVSERGYVLESGRVVLSGTGAELLADSGVVAAYLGADT